MPYKPPFLSDLNKSALSLQQYYKNNNKERLQLINVIEVWHKYFLIHPEVVLETDIRSILLGLWFFAMESIAKEYHWLDPSRSQLYELLTKHLNITKKNSPTNEERLLYLTNFDDYFKKNANKIRALYPPEFESKFNEILYKLLMDVLPLTNSHTQIQCKIPTLQYYMQHCQTENDKISKSLMARWRGVDPERDTMIKHILQLDELLRKKNTNAFISIEKEYAIRAGAMLYIMGYLEAKKTKPTNSRLFLVCQKALKINWTKEFKNVEQFEYLNTYFLFLRTHRDSNLFCEKRDKALEFKLNELKECIEIEKSHYPLIRLGKKYGEKIGQYPAKACSKAAAGFFSFPKQLISNASATGGYLILGPTGYAIGGVAGKFLADTLISQAMAKILTEIGKLAGGALGAMIMTGPEIAIKIGSHSLQQLYNLYTYLYTNRPKKNELVADPKFIKRIVVLAQSEMTQNNHEEEKQEIKKVTYS